MTAIGQVHKTLFLQYPINGANLLMIMPGPHVLWRRSKCGRGGAQSLTLADANSITSQVSNVVQDVREVSAREQVISTEQTPTLLS